MAIIIHVHAKMPRIFDPHFQTVSLTKILKPAAKIALNCHMQLFLLVQMLLINDEFHFYRAAWNADAV